jgi:hypothetical protein
MLNRPDSHPTHRFEIDGVQYRADYGFRMDGTWKPTARMQKFTTLANGRGRWVNCAPTQERQIALRGAIRAKSARGSWS